MFEEADHLADILKAGIPYYLLFALPILIICSSNPVLASEFSVQRMSQYDVNGVPYGCRASALSLEAKSLYTWNTNRHCVVAKLQDIGVDHFQKIRQKAGGLVTLLPKNIADLNVDEKEQIYLLEQAMLSQPNSIPIYFSEYNVNLEQIIEDITIITNSSNIDIEKRKKSAAAELFSSVSANSYQVIVTGASHAANKQSKIAIIQGELAPLPYNIKQMENAGDLMNNLPLIILTANLKTFGLYNEHPLNADAAVLLTLAELFSKLYNIPHMTPKYRLIFLLTENGAILNFQGVKRWLDENVQLQDDLVSLSGELIAAKQKFNFKDKNVDFVLSLDSIIQALNGELSSPIYMHVSKPPKEGTTVNNFYKLLKSIAVKYNNITVEGMHKKINLAETQLAWEHERFSMKRLPAFTLSTLKSSKEPVRHTIFSDTEEKILTETRNKAKIIAEALAQYIYNIQATDQVDIFLNTLDINENLIKSYLNLKSTNYNNDLKNSFEKYLKNVKQIYEKPDYRDPEFMFYDGQDAKLNVYRVKPAIFDLFLTILIAIYLTCVYGIIQYFPKFYDIVCKISKEQTGQTLQNNNLTANNHYNNLYAAGPGPSDRIKLKLS